MTKTQMTTILKYHGIATNEWVDMTEHIKIMPLKTTSLIFGDPLYARHRFNHSLELVELVHGETINGVFTSDNGETTNYTPTNFIPYSVIYASVSNAQRFIGGRLSHIPFGDKISKI